jgi:hypothetical protein
MAKLYQMPDHVDAKTINTLSQPEPKHISHRIHDFRISPIQVWL